MCGAPTHVRFTPDSDRESTRARRLVSRACDLTKELTPDGGETAGSISAGRWEWETVERDMATNVRTENADDRGPTLPRVFAVQFIGERWSVLAGYPNLSYLPRANFWRGQMTEEQMRIAGEVARSYAQPRKPTGGK